MKIGWIGAGRMGFEMAKRLAIGEDADNGQHVVPAHDFSADTRDSVVAAPHSVVPAQAGTQEVSTNATGFPPLMKAFEGEIARERRGCDITVWNRTRAKAEPLAQYGAKIADHLHELAGCDVVFCMVSTWDDVKEVIAGPGGLLSRGDTPRIVVECSSISIEGSAELRATLAGDGLQGCR